MKKLFFTLLSAILLVSCSSDEKKVSKVDVLSIRDIGQLATTEYTIGKVIQLKDNKAWYKFGDRDILISCKATVKAGVDFAQLDASKVVADGEKINIHLPYPMIQSFDMNPEFIRTEMENISGLRAGFTQEEKNEILRQGEQSIRHNMKKTHILEQAKKNAEAFIRNFYSEMGFSEINITFQQRHEQEITTR